MVKETHYPRPRVVLICFCTNPERCHRRLLAGYLVKLGAVDHGEIIEAHAQRDLFVEPAAR